MGNLTEEKTIIDKWIDLVRLHYYYVTRYPIGNIKYIEAENRYMYPAPLFPLDFLELKDTYIKFLEDFKKKELEYSKNENQLKIFYRQLQGDLLFYLDNYVEFYNNEIEEINEIEKHNPYPDLLIFFNKTKELITQNDITKANDKTNFSPDGIFENSDSKNLFNAILEILSKLIHKRKAVGSNSENEITELICLNLNSKLKPSYFL